MGKKEIKRTVDICDVCGREGNVYRTCEICGKEFCFICEFIGFNPTRLTICKDHQDNEEMKEVIQKFEKRFRKLDEDILNKIKEKLKSDT